VWKHARPSVVERTHQPQYPPLPSYGRLSEEQLQALAGSGPQRVPVSVAPTLIVTHASAQLVDAMKSTTPLEVLPSPELSQRMANWETYVFDEMWPGHPNKNIRSLGWRFNREMSMTHVRRSQPRTPLEVQSDYADFKKAVKQLVSRIDMYYEYHDANPGHVFPAALGITEVKSRLKEYLNYCDVVIGEPSADWLLVRGALLHLTSGEWLRTPRAQILTESTLSIPKLFVLDEQKIYEDKMMTRHGPYLVVRSFT